MRILFDTATYELNNKGNIAMLQTAVSRISGRWPEASIRIIAQGAQRLRLYFPGSEQIDPYLGGLSKRRAQVGRIASFIPRPALKAALEMREELRRRRHIHEFAPQKIDFNAWLLSVENMPYSEIDDGTDLLVA